MGLGRVSAGSRPVGVQPRDCHTRNSRPVRRRRAYGALTCCLVSLFCRRLSRDKQGGPPLQRSGCVAEQSAQATLRLPSLAAACRPTVRMSAGRAAARGLAHRGPSDRQARRLRPAASSPSLLVERERARIQLNPQMHHHTTLVGPIGRRRQFNPQSQVQFAAQAGRHSDSRRPARQQRSCCACSHAPRGHRAGARRLCACKAPPTPPPAPPSVKWTIRSTRLATRLLCGCGTP